MITLSDTQVQNIYTHLDHLLPAVSTKTSRHVLAIRTIVSTQEAEQDDKTISGLVGSAELGNLSPETAIRLIRKVLNAV